MELKERQQVYRLTSTAACAVCLQSLLFTMWPTINEVVEK